MEANHGVGTSEEAQRCEDMRLYNYLVKSPTEMLPAEKELIKRMSQCVEVDWKVSDLLGFLTVLSSIKKQAEERNGMILYSALSPTTLASLVLGIQVRDGVD